jgi:short subunit dehydrogenase-like uncharacterized protein
MIYGANGYSGDLIARAAAARGMTPILAGRSAEKLAPLGRELGLPVRVFSLDGSVPDGGSARDGGSALDRGLDGVGLVLHCAGPFSATSAPMLAACLRNGVHYLDITGEIDVFEHAYAHDQAAKDAGIVVCPGVGFDVIPTDCVAATLADAMPGAVRLALGFDTRAGMSPGTLKTSVEGLASGSRIRSGGRLVGVPMGKVRRRVDFGDGEKDAVAIPWGDVASAYRTTGIRDIAVFIPTSPKRTRGMRLANLTRPLVSLGPVQRMMKRRIERTVSGPSAEARARHRTYVWGEVADATGRTRTARIETANGYDVTVTGSLAVVEHLMNSAPGGGAYTPSQLLGKDLVSRLPGSGEMVIS